MRSLRSVAVVILTMATLFSFGLAASFAQDATPTPPPEMIPTPSPATTPTPSPAMTPTAPAAATPTVAPGAPAQGVEYPVAIHQGSCPMPTPEAEITLANTIVAGSDIAEGTFVGVTPSQPALVSSTEADISLDDLAGVQRVIAVHKSAEEFGTLVSCGTISGVKANGELVIALQEVEMSGITGTAVLEEADDQTEIRVYLNSPEAMPATPGAPATPIPAS